MSTSRHGLARLEHDVLDESCSLASVLRQVVALGGRARSGALRAWATQELQGYRGDSQELPDYRVVPAPIMIDAISGFHQIKGQQISTFDLPDFARDIVKEEVAFVQGVGELEAMIKDRQDPIIRLTPAMSAALAQIMTQRAPDRRVQVETVYWQVHVSAVQGVLDQIRTRLTQLVSELIAAMPPGQQEPTPDQVSQALQHINITVGDNSPVNVTAPSAVAHRDSTATANINGPALQPFLRRAAVLWTAVGASVAAAAAVIVWIALK
ncbi:hypothetical protein [Kitasatospora sp. NPDC057738]|uniref:AbiTii domain-containing protein n=1 Tax=Kitasatospora sp. NPDC057738 TaxID=3346233 RepID=UPI00369F96A2